jgi:hypothetical protein
MSESPKQRRERIFQEVSRLHIHPLPDPLLGPVNIKRPVRNVQLFTHFTQQQADDIRWIAAYLGTNTSALIRDVMLRALEHEPWQIALKDR